MTMAEVQLKEWGNSTGVIIPKYLMEHEGLKVGDSIKIEVIKSKPLDGFGMFKGSPAYTRDYDDHEGI